MADFARTYFDEVFKGIGQTMTTADGVEISVNDGLLRWAKYAKDVQENGGTLLFCGNGASATMAEHMSSDWFMNGKVNTVTVSETSLLTAVSNDVSYEDVFAYKVRRVLGERDMLITISSSGNSPNVIAAIKAAKEKGVFCVTVSGMKADNTSRTLGDLNFYVPLDYYGLVESAHAVLLHAALDTFLDMYQGGKH